MAIRACATQFWYPCDEVEAVETRAVTHQESPQLANKQVTAATLNGEVVTNVQVVGASGPSGGATLLNGAPMPVSNGAPVYANSESPSPHPPQQATPQPLHANSPHMHVSDRALPTPPGRPQSMPAGIPNSSNAFVRGRHRPTLSQAPPSPSLGGVTGVASLPPASLGPTPQPPALGEDFARNEGIPDIDADVIGVAGPANTAVLGGAPLVGEGGAGPGPAGPQGDIPYTVISVREPLANLREETHRLLMEQQQQHGTVHNGVMGSNHNSSQQQQGSAANISSEPGIGVVNGVGLMQSPSDGNAGSGTGTEQYYAIVQPIDEEMYAEIESAASSVTYARIEPRQNGPPRMASPPLATNDPAPASPSSVVTVVDGSPSSVGLHVQGGVPAPPTVESLRSVAQAHSRQASTSSMFATMNGGVLTVVTNGITVASQPGHVPTPGCLPNGDVNVVNNLYSTVDRSQKQPLTPQQPHNHIHRKVSEGHSGDSTTSVDQLYAKVAKKSKRPSPPPMHHHGNHNNHLIHSKNLNSHVGNSNMGTHSPQPPVPPAHPPIGAAAVMGVKYEHNNNHGLMMLGHIGSILPPMTLKRKSSRASRGSSSGNGVEDDDNDPCYEMVGGGSGTAPPLGFGLLDQEEPKYERLKGCSASSDIDPNYELLSGGLSKEDPCYEALGGNDSNAGSDADPCYERVLHHPQLHHNGGRKLPQTSDEINDPNYERLPRSGDSDVEPCYERVRPSRDDSSDLEVDPCYERVGVPNNKQVSEPQYERVRKPQREDSLSSDPGYETVKKPPPQLPATGPVPASMNSNGQLTNGNGQVRLNGRPATQRALITVNSHVLHEPDYETVNTPEIVML
ncbi:uncharacterized protein LOC111259004 isoform X3 [Varroa jacobsoni]|uniref:uncharacterized protein LOC111259004 isoform X3 n=1 Tax=Varroa jacobsoni TaxID=62625 RepID=UPI000BF75B13|nr:uncharacterized protein LOC111259004 isoform X3 [Varroa jacobsoni]